MAISEAWVDFFAGWCSGAVAVCACQPVDTVLTRLQAGPGTQLVGVSSTTSSIRMQTQGLVSSLGIGALWRGSSAMITAVPMQNALLMGGYGVGKKWSENSDHDAKTTLLSVFIGGCTGGILQSFLMSPVELMKVNQQVIGKSAPAAGKELLNGFRSNSSWRGLNATLLRDGIPHGVWFASYEWCKTCLSEQWKDSEGEKFTVPLISGAFAATVAWAVGYPFDLIKTRIQASKPSNVKSILMTGQELIQEANGRVFIGLYRGFGLKLVRAVPASMIGFTTYEFVAEKLQK